MFQIKNITMDQRIKYGSLYCLLCLILLVFAILANSIEGHDLELVESQLPSWNKDVITDVRFIKAGSTCPTNVSR